MLQVAAAAGCNNRNADCLRNHIRQIQLKTGLGAVLIHRGQQNFTCTQFINFLCPSNGVQSCRLSAACDIDFVAARALFQVRAGTRVNRNNDALAAEFLCSLCNQLLIGNSGGIDGNLICASAQQLFKIVTGANAAADSQWNKHLLCRAAHNVRDGLPVLIGRCDVQKNNLICTLLRIKRRKLYRITGVAQVDKIDTLDHAAVIDIETRNNTFCEHCHASPAATAIACLTSS